MYVMRTLHSFSWMGGLFMLITCSLIAFFYPLEHEGNTLIQWMAGIPTAWNILLTFFFPVKKMVKKELGHKHRDLKDKCKDDRDALKVPFAMWFAFEFIFIAGKIENSILLKIIFIALFLFFFILAMHVIYWATHPRKIKITIQ